MHNRFSLIALELTSSPQTRCSFYVCCKVLYFILFEDDVEIKSKIFNFQVSIVYLLSTIYLFSRCPSDSQFVLLVMVYGTRYLPSIKSIHTHPGYLFADKSLTPQGIRTNRQTAEVTKNHKSQSIFDCVFICLNEQP